MYTILDQDAKATLAALLSEATETLGAPPSLEGNLFAKMDEAFDLRLESWKVKIEEGVTTKSEVVVLDDDVVEVPRSKKRPRASDKASLPTFSKKQKTAGAGTQAGKSAPPPASSKKGKGKEQESLFTDDEDDRYEDDVDVDGDGNEKTGKGKDGGTEKEKEKEIEDSSVIKKGHFLSALGKFFSIYLLLCWLWIREYGC